MKAFLRWLNRKGIATDAFVIVLLVVGLAIAVALMVYFVTKTKGPSEGLFNVTDELTTRTGLIK